MRVLFLGNELEIVQTHQKLIELPKRRCGGIDPTFESTLRRMEGCVDRLVPGGYDAAIMAVRGKDRPHMMGFANLLLEKGVNYLAVIDMFYPIGGEIRMFIQELRKRENQKVESFGELINRENLILIDWWLAGRPKINRRE